MGADIPMGTNAEDLSPNTMPFVGSLALFKFSNGVSHVAYVDKLGEAGFHVQQGNKKAGEYTEEWVDWDNEWLIGFWNNM